MTDILVENNFKLAMVYALEILILGSKQREARFPDEDQHGGRMFCNYVAITIGLVKEKGYDFRSLLQELVEQSDNEKQGEVFLKAQKINPQKIDDDIIFAYFATIIGMFPFVLEDLSGEVFDEAQDALCFLACLSFGIVSDVVGAKKASEIAHRAFQAFYTFTGDAGKDAPSMKILREGLRGIFNPYKLAEKHKQGGDIVNDYPDEGFYNHQRPSRN